MVNILLDGRMSCLIKHFERSEIATNRQACTRDWLQGFSKEKGIECVA